MTLFLLNRLLIMMMRKFKINRQKKIDLNMKPNNEKDFLFHNKKV